MITLEQRTKRVGAANRLALALFPYHVVLFEGAACGLPGGIYVTWTSYRGERMQRRWQTRGQDFYPTWSSLWPGGGTSSTALAQVVRFARSQPVLPVSWWQYVMGEKVNLYGDRRAAVLQVLGEIDWPACAQCVLCGCDLVRYDWWNLDGVSGPCCRWTDGCRQNAKATR